MIELILAFLSGFLADIFWILWARHAGKDDKKNRKMSANYSALIGLCSIVLIYLALHNILVSGAWVVGLWLGAYYAVPIKRLLDKLIKSNETNTKD